MGRLTCAAMSGRVWRECIAAVALAASSLKLQVETHSSIAYKSYRIRNAAHCTCTGHAVHMGKLVSSRSKK